MSSPNEAGPPPVSPQAEEARRLALRRREQLYYARHMQRSRQRLHETSQGLAAQSELTERQASELQRDSEAWIGEKARAEQLFAEQAQQLGQQFQQLEASREALRQEREQFDRERSELHQQRGQHQQATASGQVHAEHQLAEVRAQLEATMAQKEAEFDQALFELQRRQRQAILEMESALAQKQEEIDKVTTELKQRPQGAPGAAEDRPGIMEAERLQRLLAARNRELAKAAEEQERDAEAFAKQRQEMRAEIDGLHQLMAEKEAQTQALQIELNRQHDDEGAKTMPPTVGRELTDKDDEIDRLKAEIGALRRLLTSARDKKPAIPPEEDALTDAPRTEAPRIVTPPPVPKQAVEVAAFAFDCAGHETELTEFRGQLEADRRDLEAQLQKLRPRQADRGGTGGHPEVEMSRERASLARERAQLERLRGEIRQDMERLQHEGGTREAMAAVHKLTGELRHPDGHAKGIGGLLRSLRGKFRDG